MLVVNLMYISRVMCWYWKPQPELSSAIQSTVPNAQGYEQIAGG